MRKSKLLIKNVIGRETSNIDAVLASRLVARQFPQWKDFPIRPIEFGGWDNKTFHLGENMIVRLPSAEEYAQQVEKENRWLPKLAPLLPLLIPTPLVMGIPADGYPWHWSIYQWIEGENASVGSIADLKQFAKTLANFLVALQKIDPTDGPLPGPHNFYRGGPLTIYDEEVKQAIEILKGKIDTDKTIAIWEAALTATMNNPPVWVHGDIAVGNLLIKNGQLNAVIDFGCLGVGDPACDLAIAWTLFEKESREAFRIALSADDGVWARGRGWALWKALIVLAELPGTNPLEIRKSRQVLEKVLADYRKR